MNIAIISGTHQQNGQSTRIGRFVSDTLTTQGHTATLFEAKNLPLWDESMWGGEGTSAAEWQKIQPTLQKAEAFIILAPEYNGTVPAALKNFFHHLSINEAAHKPALLISVVASVNGAYPIAELRTTASKNNKLVFIPDHLIIRNAETALTEDTKDTYINDRLNYSLDVLLKYAAALKTLDIQIPEDYTFGM